MTLLLKQIFAFIKLLNSETGTNELAAGLACGLILGFSPMLSLQSLIVIIICLLFRVQLGAGMLSAFFFKLVAHLVDPVADKLGRAVLESDALRPFFIELYNMPILPMTRFNNSIIMGSGIIGFILLVPMFFVFKKLILKYRELVVAKIKGTKWWKAFAATSVYKWYCTYDGLYG